MKIEIWSDVACPFCFIGKRRFESALAQSGLADKLSIEYKSFQLAPNLKTEPNESIYDSLAKQKGIKAAEAKGMSDYVLQMAQTVAINFDFDKVVPANTFKAHCLLHLAKSFHKQSEAKELLLQAYFCNGINIDDEAALLEIAESIGIEKQLAKEALTNPAIAMAVHQDMEEARQLRINGVPFFVIDRKYGISGAQDSSVFLEAIQTAYTEFNQTTTTQNK